MWHDSRKASDSYRRKRPELRAGGSSEKAEILIAKNSYW